MARHAASLEQADQHRKSARASQRLLEAAAASLQLHRWTPNVVAFHLRYLKLHNP
jgi:hypothetical protein